MASPRHRSPAAPLDIVNAVLMVVMVAIAVLFVVKLTGLWSAQLQVERQQARTAGQQAAIARQQVQLTLAGQQQQAAARARALKLSQQQAKAAAAAQRQEAADRQRALILQQQQLAAEQEQARRAGPRFRTP